MLKRNRCLWCGIISSLLSLIPTLALATNFVLVGTKPSAMGGAAVALPEGAYSLYWNPGKVEQGSSWNFILPAVGYHYEQHNQIFKKLDDILRLLGDYNLDDEEITNDHFMVQQIRNIIYDLDRQGTGLVVDAHAGCLFKKDRLLLGYLALAYGGLGVDIDTENLNVGDEDLHSIKYNRSSIDSWGLLTHQFIAGYQFPLISETTYSDYHHVFSFGFTLKYIYGLSYSYYASVYDKAIDDRDKENPFRENERRRGTLSYDLGFHYIFDDNLEAGLIIRDCSSPLFPRASRDDTPDRTVRLPLQSRLGLAYHFTPSFSTTLDLDLTNNQSSTLDGYKDQRCGLGLEKALFANHLFLRCGYYQNIAERGSDSVVTAGFGARIGLFFLEASFGITPSNYGSEHVLFIDETVGSFHISFYKPPTTQQPD